MALTALVTGSAGFIGRHMVRKLVDRGYEVDGVDLTYPIGPAVNEPGPGGENIVAYDAAAIFDEMCDDTCHIKVYDLVVHCAYHVGGREGIDGLNMNFAHNLALDSKMFSWAVRTKQKRVLYFSSCAVYPAWRQQPCDAGCAPEDYSCQDGPTVLAEWMTNPGQHQPYAPFDNYGWAKLMGERVAAESRRHGLPVTVVRPFSGYGEGQSLDYPLPAIVARARQGDLSVWGPPGQTRDWIHVSDVVNGALAVAESGTTDPVNLCTGVATEMGDLARLVWGYSYASSLKRAYGNTNWCNVDAVAQEVIKTNKATYDESKPTGAFYRVGSPTVMKQYYTPQVTLAGEGIRRMVDA